MIEEVKTDRREKRQLGRILFICKDNPFGLGGGNFSTHAYLKAFSELSGGNVDLFISDGIEITSEIRVRKYFFSPERSRMERLCSLWTGHLHRHVKPVLNHLALTDEHYDLCVFNNSKTASGLIKVVKAKGIKTVTIHHNVESEYVSDNTTNILIRKILLHHVVNTEKQSYLLSDYNLFLTRQDMDTFHRLYGSCNGVESVIGCFEFKGLPKYRAKEVDINHLVFAITGSLCTVQGSDGIKYFFDELYQYLPEGAKVIVSGRHPNKLVIDCCAKHENVKLVPDPEDMNEIINQADVYICPTRLGGGLKLRVMDGLRLGIPVISHTCSARGYDVFMEGGMLTVFSNGNSFDVGLKSLVDKLGKCEITRKSVRARYEQFFSYEAGLGRMESIFANVRDSFI